MFARLPMPFKQEICHACFSEGGDEYRLVVVILDVQVLLLQC